MKITSWQTVLNLTLAAVWLGIAAKSFITGAVLSPHLTVMCFVILALHEFMWAYTAEKKGLYK